MTKTKAAKKTGPRIGLYPGSFDPVTLGHLDIVARALPLFDTLHIAVLENPDKRTLFPVAERVAMIRNSVGGLDRVQVSSFRGLLVEYARELGAQVIVRGLRAITDFEYEFQMALMNRSLDPRIDTIYMMTSEHYSYISSRIVKEVAGFGGNVANLVPPPVLVRLRAILPGRDSR